MANREKYTRSAIGHMCAHYERKQDQMGNYYKFGNQDIDASRTEQNYNLAADDQPLSQTEFIEKRIEELHCLNRRNVNVMMTWLVTLPQNLNDKSADEKKSFFENSYNFLKARYGVANVISAYVHMDETQPHMHFAFTPVCFDKKKNSYRFNAKVVGSRVDLQTFHDQYDEYMTKQMGYVTGVRNGITEINMSITELKQIQREMHQIDEQITQIAPQSPVKGVFGYKTEEVDKLVEKNLLLEKRLYLADMSVSVVQKANEGLETELKKVKLSNSSKKREVLEHKIENLKSEIKNLDKQNQSFQNQINDLIQKNDALEEENQTLRKRIDELKEFVQHTINYFRDKYHDIENLISAKLEKWFDPVERQIVIDEGFEQNQFLDETIHKFNKLKENDEFKLWNEVDEPVSFVLTDSDNEVIFKFEYYEDLDELDLDEIVEFYEQKMEEKNLGISR